ncbi:type I restriction enzyme, R subunit [Pseudonocardia oroxyli]|uniref:Type I restriction enzyme, R subunit n=2 Tax=Pseudonocardia oroxyli TaxID=366584 RepID=A0A1G7ZRJ8_PSEOR|nr:type I restriction enzyme, R subunit [Pseudonocardia oroxyli]
MSPRLHTEEAFERVAEGYLFAFGWAPSSGQYRPELGIDPSDLLVFLGRTQKLKWDKLIELYGGDQTTAQQQFTKRLAAEIDERGVLDVLRHGVKERGIAFDLAYFRPGHTLAADALHDYNQNFLTVARQVRFSARTGESIDMVLLVNGLPVATIELKNPNTGQGTDEAIAQYRRRDPNELIFAKRAVVHFAVDPDRAYVATRLEGADTRFLPFNVGTAGPGKSGAAGNPAAKPGEYAVSYLWEQIWQRDNWLEILQRFVHVEAPKKRGVKTNPHTANRIFPRFHQWHAVQQMVKDAQHNGAGQSYLIQHSAGSGKSNTIAWLAHRLSNLFDKANEPVFHKIVVITDRTALDQQLQRTIYQFDHEPGVVKKIDEDSSQLAAALDDSTSKIIVSTLQKYPFILAKIAKMDLKGRRYAVIIDEAHTSQGGDAANRLKEALGANAVRESDDEDEATYQTRVRGKQPNLSYFAFTATPKSGTLKVFGRWNPELVNQRDGSQGMYEPFHVYSMRQAIDEGYILDVLANYLTYKTKWRLRDAAVEQKAGGITDPDVDKAKAKAAFVKFAMQHDASVAQRAKLIIEDFEQNHAGRLGGRAKAMVVTRSRQDALDLYQAILKHLDDTGKQLGVLVAYSGSLTDPDTKVERTEAQMNGFGERQLPDRFAYTKADDPQAVARDQDEYRLLIAAEKYQTGFDQPLLCGMYVDKPLTGVTAVQTLSRLNRTHPLKSQDDVRILDFVNDAESIAESFKDWFETTLTTPSDPNILYAKQREVMDYEVLVASEMELLVEILGEAGPGQLSAAADKKLHARLHGVLQPALDRFGELDEDEQDGFRRALEQYVRAYSLLAQVIDWGDRDLERLYQFGKLLLVRLPGRAQVAVDIGDADLTHFRLEFTGQHNVSLSDVGDREVRGHAADGGGAREPEMVPMSQVIDELNDRFGLGLGTSDAILVFQQVIGLVEDEKMQQIALMNDEDRFGQVANDKLDDIVLDNAGRNTDFVKHYFDNADFRGMIKEAARKRAYQIINNPIRDEALAALREQMRRETGG